MRMENPRDYQLGPYKESFQLLELSGKVISSLPLEIICNPRLEYYLKEYYREVQGQGC